MFRTVRRQFDPLGRQVPELAFDGPPLFGRQNDHGVLLFTPGYPVNRGAGERMCSVGGSVNSKLRPRSRLPVVELQAAPPLSTPSCAPVVNSKLRPLSRLFGYRDTSFVSSSPAQGTCRCERISFLVTVTLDAAVVTPARARRSKGSPMRSNRQVIMLLILIIATAGLAIVRRNHSPNGEQETGLIPRSAVTDLSDTPHDRGGESWQSSWRPITKLRTQSRRRRPNVRKPNCIGVRRCGVRSPSGSWPWPMPAPGTPRPAILRSMP